MSQQPSVDADRALGQSDECRFTLLHCDQPMRWKHSRSTWEGKWPEGSQTTSNSYACDGCGAVLDTKITEPDTRPRAAPSGQ